MIKDEQEKRKELITKTAKVAANWWADRLKKGDKEKFVQFLQQKIEQHLSISPGLDLRCDYDPWGVLLDAVREAGIECSGVLCSAEGILPMKHSLTIKPGLLIPKEGYGNFTDNIIID